MAKNLFLGLIWGANFFFKILALSVIIYHGQLLSCTISEKTNNPILKKLSDGQTDALTDGQTEASDFIGGCPTNIVCPNIKATFLFHSNFVLFVLATR